MANTGFYSKLRLPAGIIDFITKHENVEFEVFADPDTGLFAGIVRRDVLETYIELKNKTPTPHLKRIK